MMGSAWEGWRSTRTALLAVNALLLGTPSCATLATAVTASVAATSSWRAGMSAGHGVSSSRSTPRIACAKTSSSSTTTTETMKLKSREEEEEREQRGVDCRASTSSPVAQLRMLTRRAGGWSVAFASTTTTDRGSGSSEDKDDTKSLNKNALWSKRLRAREPAAAGLVMSERASQRHHRRQELSRQWTQRLRNRRKSSRKDDCQLQHEEQERPHDPVSSRTVAGRKTKVDSAPALAAAAVASPTQPGVAPPSSPPSYLSWSDTKNGEKEPTVKSDSNRSRRRGLLSFGKGNRRRHENDSAGEGDADGTATESESERSLGAAKSSRGGSAAISLSFKEAMFAGAVSRSIAQTCMQPANVVKTLLQGRGTSSQLSNLSFKLLTRGAGAQFVMSMPHGAFNFATLEVILGCSARIFPLEWREKAGPVLDFFSSSVATFVCSAVSTPQMVITDRIMAGMYPNFVSGIREIARTEGLRGFYTGWSANVAQKIPSYGLTWVFFQQFKRLHRKATDRPPTNTENFVLGAAAAGATVCIMIPMDTVKTRLVTQVAQPGVEPYKGVLQTLSRVVKEEGLGSVYRSLTPRLVSVVPMIGIQFGIYEFIRKEIMGRKEAQNPSRSWLPPAVSRALGAGRGRQQPDYVKDFLRNVQHMKEELV